MPRSPHRSTIAIILGAAILNVAAMMPGLTATAWAADEVRDLVIRNHRFEPPEIRLPANTAAQITVRNLDKTAEEFESKSLKIEKIVPGGGQALIRIRPLAKGRYEFFGEYNEKTAHGVLVVE